MLEKVIGYNVKRIRMEKNIQQEDLAEELGISTTHLSKIESGANRPSLGLIEKLSKGLGVYPNKLFSNDELASEGNIELNLTLATIYTKIPTKYHDEIINFNRSLASLLEQKDSENKR